MLALIIFTGRAVEGQPITRNEEETAKRILAAAQSGRLFLHFSNCQGFVQDAALQGALTSEVINGRDLGATKASSDLELPNIAEYSLSGNVGFTMKADFSSSSLS